MAAPAQAQRGKTVRIGIIDNAPVWVTFRQGRRDVGYVEGQNFAYEYRTTDGTPEALAQAVAELVGIPVDLTATFGTLPSKRRSRRPRPSLSSGLDRRPGRAGLVPNLARPGGNITGNTILDLGDRPEAPAIPQGGFALISRVAFLWNGQRLECADP